MRITNYEEFQKHTTGVFERTGIHMLDFQIFIKANAKLKKKK